jgi:hypothetical protein
MEFPKTASVDLSQSNLLKGSTEFSKEFLTKDLSDELLKIIHLAEEKDGHNRGYLYMNLPNHMTGLNSYPPQNNFLYGLRIPIQEKFNLEEILIELGIKNMISEGQERCIVDNILTQIDKTTLEFYGEASTIPEFEVSVSKLKDLANRVYEVLNESGNINRFDI